MYGNSPGYRPGSGGRGRGRGAPPPPPPGAQVPANNPAPIYQQYPNMVVQNSALFAANQFMQNLNYSMHNPNFSNPAPNFQAPNFRPRPVFNQGSRPQQSGGGVERIVAAVAKARSDLIAAKESVTAWKVSQSALLLLHAESWESLGLQMQQVPPLNRLIATEGKINEFIHCFAAVQRITSLYDLEVAICKNEGIRQFEELEMGPLLRHPLVIHYFCMDSDVTEVYKITSQDIISYLCKFMGRHEGKVISTDEFMEFVAKKRSAKSKGKLGVHIQNLGTLITYIREASRSESCTVKKVLNTSKQKSVKENRKRPLLAFLQKKELDDRYNSIAERIKSFSSENGPLGNKHIRFDDSSESEDDDGDDSEEEVNENEEDTQNKSVSQDTVNCDRASRCPYPSAAEEISRLGLRGEKNDKASPDSGSGKHKESAGLLKKRGKPETPRSSRSARRKLRKKSKFLSYAMTDVETKGSSARNEAELLLADQSLRMFVTTWKDACQVNSVPEVFERMLQFYNATDSQRKKLKAIFSSYPCIGLLNIAVTSIKQGMLDSIYDSFQTSTEQDVSLMHADKVMDYEMIEVEPTERGPSIQAPKTLEQRISVELIIKKVSSYFEDDANVQINVKALLTDKFMFLRRLWSCVYWLNEQFSIQEFESLGYGDFFTFLEKHVALLPDILRKCLASETYQKLPMEASMHQQQFALFLSQASNCLGASKKASKEAISALLVRQFPSVCFSVVGDGLSDDFIDTGRDSVSGSSRVLFSTMLLHSFNGLSPEDINVSRTSGERTVIGNDAGMFGYVTTKNAVDTLLKAPMLADLESWSHWSQVYAPTLGPLVDWLLSEVNTKELLCVVTRDGKVVRVNHTATVDSFLEASVQRSSFHAAVGLLSLLALYGGEKHVPLSLLKGYARQAFELFVKDDVVGFSSNSGDCKNKSNKLVAVISKFFIDCLCNLPAEFRSYAADILLSGLRSVMKDSVSSILVECKQTEERLMLHEVGLSLGVVEWIDDYHSFSACATSCSQTINNEFPEELKFDRDVTTSPYSQGSMLIAVEEDLQNKGSVRMHSPSNHGFGDSLSDNCTQKAFEAGKENQALQVIEHIRREEFGLDSELPDRESSMLKKQHARLGRALHCLSQELYSQDSHFLLELVQNADDNKYPENVEPTLSFILQDSGIVVLNNEQGFSVQNIKALCDIGNSTKKGSGAGYIGKKGIGFKSVFRVTDAPEIHSNGFHVKFDISEGQIGFVLPTVIPPCDVKLFQRLAFGDKDNMDTQFWNTCIVLPFRPNFAEGHAISSIVSLFSDLHPSLLLFLHRLQCIRFRNMLDSSLIIMRKEIVGNGIVKVSFGKERLTWFVASQELKADTIRSDVHKTEISLAFTLEESEDGVYVPHLEQQPVFAFLPLRRYGLKFIVQGDFVLPSSREEVDGDSPWNQWLLSKFPDLFVDSEKSFCALPCFRGNPGKAVAAFMSFVPLVGEVHGFFSSLPRLIISKLSMSKCLLMEGNSMEWVLPCKTIRCWNEQARSLLPDSMLCEHLGLGFLDKNIVMSDSLARDLGVEDYGPRILVQILTSLCQSQDGLQSLGLSWLGSYINSLYAMLFDSYGQISLESGALSAIIHNLKKVPFIPLSDGTYSSVDEGTIWVQNDTLHLRYDNSCGLDAFSLLYAKLRTVNPAFLSAMTSNDDSCLDMPVTNNLLRMLQQLGVQQLSAHDIVKVHILPVISDTMVAIADENLMVEYLSFLMLHLQSSCSNCETEKGHIITELHDKALILTNDGYKRLGEVSIYCSKEFGNPIDVDKLTSGLDLEWYEVNDAYLKHPITRSLPDGMLKWREFFQGIGIADFVHVVPVEKSLSDVSPSVIKNILLGGDRIPNKAVIKDWESPELTNLLDKMALNGDGRRFKYLLEVFDELWEDCFHHKVVAQCIIGSTEENLKFASSFISSLRGVRWLVSSMNSELCSANELFNDCDSVRSILGDTAPYVVPKVQSKNLSHDIGLKTDISPEDILKVLQLWRRCETPFVASVAQMSRFYSFIWNEMATMKEKILPELLRGAFIFIPYSCGSKLEDAVPGVLLSYSEVYWHDLTGSENQMKEIHASKDSGIDNHLCMTLCNLYPNLHDFFVQVCGVSKTPSLQSYLQILLQLSAVALPSQAANMVFQVLLQWSDGLKSGTLSSEDVVTLRESLLKQEFTVLPTKVDKWVSLHPSFGLLCWGDDEKLKKEFKNSGHIDLLYFGELSHDEKEILKTKVSALLHALGIPGLSEVVSREAIHEGVVDSRSKASLVNWVLPYAQRYIYKTHRDTYAQFMESGFQNLNNLQIVVVEKLFYRNIIKGRASVSKKHHECSCLLEGNVLYATRDSDSHALFMELTRLLFNGTPDLHTANFLHMVTTMAESGSNQEQTEYFVLNSQKIPMLPDEEPIWSLPSVPSPMEIDQTPPPPTENAITPSGELNPPKPKVKPWPPVNWNSAPGYKFGRPRGSGEEETVPDLKGPLADGDDDDDSEERITEADHVIPTEINAYLDIEGNQAEASSEDQFNPVTSGGDNLDLAGPTEDTNLGSSFNTNEGRQLSFGMPNPLQALLTGRLGEHIAYNYFTNNVGKTNVTWVNQQKESGLPYDLVVGDEGSGREYIEVKATKSGRKDWFSLSVREWQFSIEKGDYFSIAHVHLYANNMSRITVFRNPARLCQLGKLKLAILMPKPQQ